MESWLTKLVPVARTLLMAGAVYGAIVFFAQRLIAFPGTMRDSPRPTPTAPRGVEQLWLETTAGRIEAWLVPAEGPGPHPTLVFAHGNGELISDWIGELTDLAAHGVSAVAVEFPGYGHSEGKPTRATIREAMATTFDVLSTRADVHDGRIVAWGRSMGGGAAGDLALDRPVAALVLQSTYSSTMDVARSMFVPGFLVRDRFDNRAAVRGYSGPVLLMHGPEDDVIPYAHSERIAAARAGLRVTVLDCAHNDCGRIWPEIRDHILGFLRAEGLLDAAT